MYFMHDRQLLYVILLYFKWSYVFLAIVISMSLRALNLRGVVVDIITHLPWQMAITFNLSGNITTY